MDNLSVINQIESVTPARDVQSRDSNSEDFPQRGNKRFGGGSHPSPEEEEQLPGEDDPHAVDERA